MQNENKIYKLHFSNRTGQSRARFGFYRKKTIEDKRKTFLCKQTVFADVYRFNMQQ